MTKPRILVIVGQTASGKSALAVRLAKKLNGEVISADSRQVYTGLDIGTGKITKQEMRGIPHHLLDVADPRGQFSVAQYRELAQHSLRYIGAKNKLPIVVGGTGFYIDVLTGLVSLPDVPPDKKFRKRLESKSAGALFKILKNKDPRRAGTIDPNNKVRLVRALEIIKTLGQVPTRRRGTSTTYEFMYIGFKPDNLEKSIYDRLIKRLPSMIKEAKKLIRLRAISYRRMHELGLEYRYLGLYLQGRLSKQQMVEKLYAEIRHYAKRQMTWFKRNKKIKWFKLKELKEIEKYVRMHLSGD